MPASPAAFADAIARHGRALAFAQLARLREQLVGPFARLVHHVGGLRVEGIGAVFVQVGHESLLHLVGGRGQFLRDGLVLARLEPAGPVRHLVDVLLRLAQAVERVEVFRQRLRHNRPGVLHDLFVRGVLLGERQLPALTGLLASGSAARDSELEWMSVSPWARLWGVRRLAAR